MQFSHAYKMSGEGRFHDAGQHRDAIFVPFPLAHHDVVGAEVDIFHS